MPETGQGPTFDAGQRWFWTERWQRMEREADADFAAGRFAQFDDLEGFIADLDGDDGDAGGSNQRPLLNEPYVTS